MEYGGLPWAGALGEHGPLVVFVHFADQRMYRFEPDVPGAVPEPLTPEVEIACALRFADLDLDVERGQVRCVLEEMTGERPHEVRRALAAVPLDGSAAEDRGALRETGGGHRFLTGARISPDGRRAAWIAWDHPAMPWDGTELRVADIGEDGVYERARTLAGGPEESVVQAEWATDGTLVAASDRTGWWNLYRIDTDTGEAVSLCEREEEFAGPLWRVGPRWFTPLPDRRIAVLHGRGAQRLAVLDPSTGELTDVPGPWTEWAGTLAVTGPVTQAGPMVGAGTQAEVEREGEAEPGAAAALTGVAGSPQHSFQVVQMPIFADGAVTAPSVIGGGDGEGEAVDPAWLPEPVRRTFTGPDGSEVHACVHPPRNPGFTAAEEELPPYAIWVHGGPTSRVPFVRDLEIAYFTSRGIGVAVVDYGGSTGYGRRYRNRLRGNWGVVDVEDCETVAKALAAEGLADGGRLAIRGGSAGGWTSGASLVRDTVYRCGVIFFPVLDLVNFGPEGTHDFEAHYMHSLIGPLPEQADRYRERSPVHRADRLSRPFVLLQGLDDVICPPAQSERFLAAAAERGVPHAYLAFEGEGHGFRRLETMVACLEAELSLYGQVFGFDPPGVPTLRLSRDPGAPPAADAPTGTVPRAEGS
jgi:dienelactone hydrolase